MNKQLIKLLVLGLGFATVGNTMLAAKDEPKKEETKKEEVKKEETKKDENTQTWGEWFKSFYSNKSTSDKKEEVKPVETPKTDTKAVDTKKVETKTCFCTQHKTALIWTGSAVVGLGLATAAVLYFDLLGLNDQEEETEEEA